MASRWLKTSDEAPQRPLRLPVRPPKGHTGQPVDAKITDAPVEAKITGFWHSLLVTAQDGP
eukprot:1018888-Pyramimonas_sp.AAC.1